MYGYATTNYATSNTTPTTWDTTVRVWTNYDDTAWWLESDVPILETETAREHRLAKLLAWTREASRGMHFRSTFASESVYERPRRRGRACGSTWRVLLG